MKERYEFDEVTLLSAVAVGQPGKRTFFITVGQNGEWIRVWLEKEQLQALALAIHQFLDSLPEEMSLSSSYAPVTSISAGAQPGFPAAELEIDEIALGYAEGKVTLNLVVHALGPQRLEGAVVECRTTLEQIQQFGDEALKICAAGRPRCPICGGPIDPEGHVCPRSN
jgi:uncharacterized repeat protein (TIGR03847 family)